MFSSKLKSGQEQSLQFVDLKNIQQREDAEALRYIEMLEEDKVNTSSQIVVDARIGNRKALTVKPDYVATISLTI